MSGHAEPSSPKPSSPPPSDNCSLPNQGGLDFFTAVLGLRPGLHLWRAAVLWLRSMRDLLGSARAKSLAIHPVLRDREELRLPSCADNPGTGSRSHRSASAGGTSPPRTSNRRKGRRRIPCRNRNRRGGAGQISDRFVMNLNRFRRRFHAGFIPKGGMICALRIIGRQGQPEGKRWPAIRKPRWSRSIASASARAAARRAISSTRRPIRAALSRRNSAAPTARCWKCPACCRRPRWPRRCSIISSRSSRRARRRRNPRAAARHRSRAAGRRADRSSGATCRSTASHGDGAEGTGRMQRRRQQATPTPR